MWLQYSVVKARKRAVAEAENWCNLWPRDIIPKSLRKADNGASLSTYVKKCRCQGYSGISTIGSQPLVWITLPWLEERRNPAMSPKLGIEEAGTRHTETSVKKKTKGRAMVGGGGGVEVGKTNAEHHAGGHNFSRWHVILETSDD